MKEQIKSRKMVVKDEEDEYTIDQCVESLSLDIYEHLLEGERVDKHISVLNSLTSALHEINTYRSNMNETDFVQGQR